MTGAAGRPPVRSAPAYSAAGADTILWLATSPDVERAGGGFYLDRRRRPFDRYPGTRLSAAHRRELGRIVSRLAGGASAG